HLPLGDAAAEQHLEEDLAAEEDGEQRRQDADRQRDGEALHGARAEVVQHDGGDQRGDVGVDDGDEGAVVAGLERLGGGLALGLFLPDSLVDEDVGVDRHADRQDDAGNAGQRQRGVEERHDGHQVDQVQDHRDDRDESRGPVVQHHEHRDREDRDAARQEAAADGVFAQRRADERLGFRLAGAARDGADGGGEAAAPEDDRELLGVVLVLRAGDLAAAVEGGRLDRGGRLHLPVEHDDDQAG